MPEQLSEEELRNMSPEQLAELQKQNCIFCHIAAGRVQSKIVYEDPRTIAVLDINPASLGHILILPKDHYVIMPQAPDEEIVHLFGVAKKLSEVVLKSLKAKGTTIFVANGSYAGQKAPHFMIHVIPRKEGDGLENLNIAQKKITEDQLEKVRLKLKKKINEMFNIEEDLEGEPKKDIWPQGMNNPPEEPQRTEPKFVTPIKREEQKQEVVEADFEEKSERSEEKEPPEKDTNEEESDEQTSKTTDVDIKELLGANKEDSEDEKDDADDDSDKKDDLDEEDSDDKEDDNSDDEESEEEEDNSRSQQEEQKPNQPQNEQGARFKPADLDLVSKVFFK